MPQRRKILFALEYYDPEMHKGVVDYAREQDWDLQVVSPSNGPVYRFWEGDGIISCASTDPNNEMTRFVLDFKGPRVDLGKASLKFPGKKFGCVFEDNKKIGQMAAKYFFNKGFQHFHYVAAGPCWHVCDRGDSFRQSVIDAGYSSSECYISECISDMKEVFSFLASNLKTLPNPMAIFCGFDNVAQWVIQACRLVGLRVPEDISVLGTANHEMVCEWGDTPSSSIDTNVRFWAYRAAQLIDDLIDKKVKPGIEIEIPPLKVVERKSTDTTAVNDDVVAKAMRFIQENLRKSISVDELVDFTGTPRSTLVRKFRITLGRSIIQEINRQKIESARRLLADKSKNSVAIAAELGFSSQYYFYRVFKQETGMTPKQYRSELFSNDFR